MQRIETAMIEKAIALLSSGEVTRVLGWKKGELGYDVEPCVFKTEESLKDFCYNAFCGANLCKYLVEESKKEGKILVFLKPCDSYSFNQLIKEHRIKKENVYTIGVECQGKVDPYKLKENGIEIVDGAVETVDNVTVKANGKDYSFKKEDIILGKCLTCTKKPLSYDDAISFNEKREPALDRFEMVKKLEAMTADERYAFWKDQLSNCIRCNACRNVCPACTCTKCVFDNDNSGIASKANSDSFEEKLFHIIRAFHVAGRCTDCGECSRVCPSRIPLQLLNRKFISDIDRLYGEYQAGEDTDSKGPLTNYTTGDVDPSEVFGGND
ncbi:MAG: 4Fe-4S dicluster domain-containing protein [Clostridia bacterium]|nr:4Fe-4S dicluster domain-containing protein [Clostridia bacterium]